MVRAQDVRFSYGEVEVLRGVSLSLSKGELLGMVGPNGSGKTTLLRIISGFLKPGSGRVLLGSEEVARLGRREVAKRVAVVPQEEGWDFGFTVGQTVLMGRHPHQGLLSFDTPKDLGAAKRAMAMAGLEELMDRPLNMLSGGERRRVLLARALAQEPSVLLMDEPTAFLDLKHQVELFSLARSLSEEGGLACLLVSHDLSLTARFCHTLVVLKDGLVHAAGPPGEVLTNELVREVYGVEARVGHDPETGALHISVLGPSKGV